MRQGTSVWHCRAWYAQHDSAQWLHDQGGPRQHQPGKRDQQRLRLHRRYDRNYVQLHRYEQGRDRLRNGHRSVTSATQDVSNVNISSLPGGTLTYNVTLTDAEGNIGTAATATAAFE